MWMMIGLLLVAASWGQQGGGHQENVKQSKGLFPVVDHGKFGYADTKGRTVVVPQFDQARNFVEGLAFVERGGLWGCIDTTGRVVIPFQFDWAYDFSHGLARVGIGMQWGYVDPGGRVVFEPVEGPSSGMAEMSTLAQVRRCRLSACDATMRAYASKLGRTEEAGIRVSQPKPIVAGPVPDNAQPDIGDSATRSMGRTVRF